LLFNESLAKVFQSLLTAVLSPNRQCIECHRRERSQGGDFKEHISSGERTKLIAHSQWQCRTDDQSIQVALVIRNDYEGSVLRKVL
jgi:hypothetical protein